MDAAIQYYNTFEQFFYAEVVPKLLIGIDMVLHYFMGKPPKPSDLYESDLEMEAEIDTYNVIEEIDNSDSSTGEFKSLFDNV